MEPPAFIPRRVRAGGAAGEWAGFSSLALDIVSLAANRAVDPDASTYIVSPRVWGQPMTRTRKAVTRVDLCEAVHQKVGLSRTESSALVELVLKEITVCLEKGRR
jgi:hypothetical protein